MIAMYALSIVINCMQVMQVVLQLKVSGNNLVNVSKLVLMVCKAPSNDDILLQNNIPGESMQLLLFTNQN